MQSFTSHNVVIVPVISKNYLIILSVYLTFLFVSISAMQIVQHTSPNSGDIPLHAGSGKSPLSSGCLPYAAGYAATGCATRIPLAISDLGIFRVVKMPTLKMVNSLLLSDLLVACPLNSRCSRQQGCPCGDLPTSALEGGAHDSGRAWSSQGLLVAGYTSAVQHATSCKKEFILENPSQIFTNLFFKSLLKKEFAA